MTRNSNDDLFLSPSSTRGIHGEFQEIELNRAGPIGIETHVLRLNFPSKRRQIVARLRRLADEIEEGKR